MTQFRIIKISPKNRVTRLTSFNTQTEAEGYAQKVSLKDDHHTYEVQKPSLIKGNFETVVSFKNGQEIIRSHDTLKKQQE